MSSASQTRSRLRHQEGLPQPVDALLRHIAPALSAVGWEAGSARELLPPDPEVVDSAIKVVIESTGAEEVRIHERRVPP